MDDREAVDRVPRNTLGPTIVTGNLGANLLDTGNPFDDSVIAKEEYPARQAIIPVVCGFGISVKRGRIGRATFRDVRLLDIPHVLVATHFTVLDELEPRIGVLVNRFQFGLERTIGGRVRDSVVVVSCVRLYFRIRSLRSYRLSAATPFGVEKTISPSFI